LQSSTTQCAVVTCSRGILFLALPRCCCPPLLLPFLGSQEVSAPTVHQPIAIRGERKRDEGERKRDEEGRKRDEGERKRDEGERKRDEGEKGREVIGERNEQE
jgi:hypothetical protein